MPDEFVLQLIQKTLEELGYELLLDTLAQQVKVRRFAAHEQQEHNAQVQTVEWFFAQLADGNYFDVDSFLLSVLSVDETASVLGSLSSNPSTTMSPDSMLSFLSALTDCNDPKSVLMMILYLVRRIYYFEMVLSENADSTKLLSFLRDNLMPVLDELNAKRDNKFDFEVSDCSIVFGPEICLRMNRESESACLSDITFGNFTSIAKILTPHNLLGQDINPSSLTNTSAIPKLRALLAQKYLNGAFKLDQRYKTYDTIYNIPPGYLKTLVKQSLVYQKFQHPYYLFPRTNAEERKLRLTNGDKDNDLMLNGDRAKIHDHFEENVFPNTLLHTLNHHDSQVWYAKFSPLGKYLVSGSEDGKLILYDVMQNFKVVKTLESSESMDNFAFVPFSAPVNTEKTSAVIYCAWDPTETYLVCCSLDTVVRVWSVNGLHVPNKRITRSMDTTASKSLEPEFKLVSCFTLGLEIRTWSCEFLPNEGPDYKPQFIVGSPDKVLKAFDVEGNELFDFYGNIDNSWELPDATPSSSAEPINSTKSGKDVTMKDEEDADKKDAKAAEKNFNRINDIAITPNGKILVTVNHDKQVHFYLIPDFSNPEATTKRLACITFKGRLTSCSISNNGKYLLINSAPEELDVWDISGMYSEHFFENPILYKRLIGHNQGSYVIRSCFGYLMEETGEEELILSGSDDGFIYYWKLHTGQLVGRSKGHVGVCNSVDWNTFGTYTDALDYGKMWCSVGDDHVVKIWGI